MKRVIYYMFEIEYSKYALGNLSCNGCEDIPSASSRPMPTDIMSLSDRWKKAVYLYCYKVFLHDLYRNIDLIDGIFDFNGTEDETKTEDELIHAMPPNGQFEIE